MTVVNECRIGFFFFFNSCFWISPIPISWLVFTAPLEFPREMCNYLLTTFSCVFLDAWLLPCFASFIELAVCTEFHTFSRDYFYRSITHTTSRLALTMVQGNCFSGSWVRKLVNMCVCVCVWVSEREVSCMYVCVCERETEREVSSVCVCVCVCV